MSKKMSKKISKCTICGGKLGVFVKKCQKCGIKDKNSDFNHNGFICLPVDHLYDMWLARLKFIHNSGIGRREPTDFSFGSFCDHIKNRGVKIT